MILSAYYNVLLLLGTDQCLPLLAEIYLGVAACVGLVLHNYIYSSILTAYRLLFL